LETMTMSEETKAAPQDPTGHYGPGYGEAVKHLGEKPPESAPGMVPVAPVAEDIVGAKPPTVPSPVQGADPESPALDSENVTARPPDRLSGENVPASENAGLIFERS